MAAKSAAPQNLGCISFGGISCLQAPAFGGSTPKPGPCRSAERRRCSNGYKFAKGKLAKTTAKAQAIASSLCELVAPRCGAGGWPHLGSVFILIDRSQATTPSHKEHSPV